MSCIRFNTPAQREQMRRLAPSMLTPEEVAAMHPAPPVTESKIRRLRLLATSENPKIREAAASSYHAPADLLETLAQDPDDGVRGCVARNEATPCDVLRSLVADPSELVRGFLAINYYVPGDAMAALADDPSVTVRALVSWKAGLAAEAAADDRVAGTLQNA
ncbi:hypothetical protein ACFOYW_15760 [Gryllotalpicola reticulitermitis]|uniref:Leucine rich repeat variant n=1 Tax=Gryllotalpicola reticulitermitis TaxID=1184153 RepID=A0ABV8Q914_9MICO